MHGRNGNGMSLHHRVLAVKQAVKAAGFGSSRFKPTGTRLRIEVVVPIVLDDCSGSVGLLVDRVLAQLADEVQAARDRAPCHTSSELSADVETPAGKPHDLRTKAGRAWRAKEKAEATP